MTDEPTCMEMCRKMAWRQSLKAILRSAALAHGRPQKIRDDGKKCPRSCRAWTLCQNRRLPLTTSDLSAGTHAQRRDAGVGLVVDGGLKAGDTGAGCRYGRRFDICGSIRQRDGGAIRFRSLSLRDRSYTLSRIGFALYFLGAFSLRISADAKFCAQALSGCFIDSHRSDRWLCPRSDRRSGWNL